MADVLQRSLSRQTQARFTSNVSLQIKNQSSQHCRHLYCRQKKSICSKKYKMDAWCISCPRADRTPLDEEATCEGSPAEIQSLIAAVRRSPEFCLEHSTLLDIVKRHAEHRIAVKHGENERQAVLKYAPNFHATQVGIKLCHSSGAHVASLHRMQTANPGLRVRVPAPSTKLFASTRCPACHVRYLLCLDGFVTCIAETFQWPNSLLVLTEARPCIVPQCIREQYWVLV